MVSLLKLAEITEEGVRFKSPRDGSEMMLTPEKSIELQNAIGADIIMQLDDVVSTLTTGDRVIEAMERTIRWLDRCISAHQYPERQNLFPIVQGGTDLKLRETCIKELTLRDCPGYAIGGLSGGEDKELFWKTVRHCTELLPADKPIYCMGVGYAVDLVVCVALGVDMFDCVYPTRTARFGTALTRQGNLSLKQSQFRADFRPIENDCDCLTCRRYSRAFLHSIATKETVASHLLTHHNISFQLRLMKDMRDHISSGSFPDFVRSFMKSWFPDGKVPNWINNALLSVAIEI